MGFYWNSGKNALAYEFDGDDESIELSDPIDPVHYNRLNPEPRDVAIAWGLDYCEGAVLKYLARWRHKNGVEDLKKAKNYIERIIQYAEEDNE